MKSEMPSMHEGKSKYYKRCPNCGCKTAMEKEE